MLAGILMDIQSQAFEYLRLLESQTISENTIVEIANFLSNKMNVVISSEFEKYAKEYQIDYLRDKLNRPIRVCGIGKK